jgi:UDP-GlcNAc:undecaprenyl-phosphate GlcNAc-1-phosphate transferase
MLRCPLFIYKYMFTIYPFVTAFFVCLVAIWLLAPLAKRLGLTDLPSERKYHVNAVPLIGGIAVFLGFGFALLTADISLAEYRCLIAVATMLVFIGLLDDFHELSPHAKLIAQLIAGLLTIFWGNNQLISLGPLLVNDHIILGICGIPLTILAVIGLINAINMIDGVDGLASGISFIILSFLSYFAFYAGQTYTLIVLLVFCSSLLGFLCCNFPFSKNGQARIFLGDAGSMLLGFMIVWFTMRLSQDAIPAARPVTMLWLVALPLYDMVNVVLQRLMHKHSPFMADRRHFHHLLLLYLEDPRKVCAVAYGLTLTSGFIAVAGEIYHISDRMMLVGFVAFFIGYLTLNRYLWKLNKKN